MYERVKTFFSYPSTKANAFRIVLTAIYFFILISLTLSLWRYFSDFNLALYYNNNPLAFLTSFYITLSFRSLFSIFVYALPIALALIIHRTFKQGIILLLIFYILYVLWGIHIINTVDVGMAGIGIIATWIFYPIILFIASIIGLIFRKYYSKSRSTKIILAILPFIILFVLLMSTIIKAENSSVQDCENLQSPFEKSKCFYQFALLNKDPSLCFKEDSGDFPAKCVSELKEYATVGLCQNYKIGPEHNYFVSLVGEKLYCYYSLVIITDGDESFCDGLNPEETESCKLAVVIKDDNNELCKNLSLERKVSCYKQFS